MTRWSSLALLVIAAGCFQARWAREEIKPGQLDPRQEVKIWSGDSLARWHAVLITRDSITGIPYKMSTECDCCRVGLPVLSVDSIRVGNPESFRDYLLFLLQGVSILALIDLVLWGGD